MNVEGARSRRYGLASLNRVRVLTRGPDAGLIVQSAGAVLGSVVLVVLVWRAGLRRYTGATS